jgi:predicted nucleic acid-binding protein
MLYGAKKKNSTKITSKVLDFLKIAAVVPFDEDAADIYADIKKTVRRLEIWIC